MIRFKFELKITHGLNHVFSGTSTCTAGSLPVALDKAIASRMAAIRNSDIAENFEILVSAKTATAATLQSDDGHICHISLLDAWEVI